MDRMSPCKVQVEQMVEKVQICGNVGPFQQQAVRTIYMTEALLLSIMVVETLDNVDKATP